MAPEETVAAPVVVPVVEATDRRRSAPATVDRPEYSSATTPTSALAVGLTVIVGRVPPPAVTGAVQTLISVSSEALKCNSST